MNRSKIIPAHSIPRFLMLLLAMVSLTSCGDKKNSQNTGESLTSPTQLKQLAAWPTPGSYVKDIPVYEKFSGLEPLFRMDNDTTYVINFWATWCKPCIEELPYFEALDSIYKNEKVQVVLVSLDFPKQLESNLVPFVEKNGIKSKVVVLLDGKYNDWIDKVSPEWSGAIPATYTYKGSQSRLVGMPFESTEELLEVIKPFL